MLTTNSWTFLDLTQYFGIPGPGKVILEFLDFSIFLRTLGTLFKGNPLKEVILMKAQTCCTASGA